MMASAGRDEQSGRVWPRGYIERYALRKNARSARRAAAIDLGKTFRSREAGGCSEKLRTPLCRLPKRSPNIVPIADLLRHERAARKSKS
jgi:hypothetical protein